MGLAGDAFEVHEHVHATVLGRIGPLIAELKSIGCTGPRPRKSSTLPTLACAQLVNEGRFPGAVKFKPPSGVSFWKIPLMSRAALMSERRGSALGARATGGGELSSEPW